MADSDNDSAPEMVFSTGSRKIYHADPDCQRRGDNDHAMSLAVAIAWDYSECCYCDPDHQIGVDSAGNPCEDCGRWRGRPTLDGSGRSLCLDCREKRLSKGGQS